ncbi:hypothetical protein HNQ64_002935 [Prosthecobacter dejongeii]|uniref:Uncharacterized protein n=1 Tax=Prosthecobacter dejongeii TaxID=48465 RepID=A0A7W8DQS9_9BACT|nr:hypothetical protein [Prosthecobacter dejongeii]
MRCEPPSRAPPGRTSCRIVGYSVHPGVPARQASLHPRLPAFAPPGRGNSPVRQYSIHHSPSDAVRPKAHPSAPFPPPRRGERPIAGGEGAQHREPPDPHLTKNASPPAAPWRSARNLRSLQPPTLPVRTLPKPSRVRNGTTMHAAPDHQTSSCPPFAPSPDAGGIPADSQG